MSRPQWIALGIVLAFVWSAVALATESSVLFVLDGSGSMQAKLNGRAKMEHARTLLSQLIKTLPPDKRVGLATFGHTRKDDCSDIEILAPIGSADSAVIKAMESIHPKGMTPLTGAMQLAAAQFREHEGAAQVVMISDGKETCQGDPCAAVREARAGGVKMQVHVIGFDVTPEETTQLKCIAEAGDGKYFAAANAAELRKALTQVKQEVSPAEVKPSVAQAQPSATPSPAKPKQQVLFEEKFDRDELGELYEVLNPDPNRLTLNDGKLLIVATHPPKNHVLLQKTFSGDFIATAQMTMEVTGGNTAGLYYWIDNQNYLFIGVHGGKSRYNKPLRLLFFDKMVSGQKNQIAEDRGELGKRTLTGYSEKPETWYIQLERKGVNYMARLSADGSQWINIGTHTILQKGGRFGFGLDSGKGTENAAEFGALVVQGAE